MRLPEFPPKMKAVLAQLKWLTKWDSRRALTFRAKIAAAGAAIATLVLVVASICLGLFYFATEREQLVDGYTGAAALVAETVSAAIVFDDPISGGEAVMPYVNSEGIDAVRILRSDGAVFAERSMKDVDWPANINGSLVTSSMVYVETPVFAGEEQVGRVLMAANLDAFYAVVQKMLLVLTILVIGGALIAGFVSTQLANRIMRPVQRLANAMDETRRSGDFSQRVVSQAKDEFGRLVSRYNDLLEQLATNDRELQQSLFELMAARDEAQAGNVAKSQFLANMSHELRTPLNAVIGYSNLLLQDPVAMDHPEVADDLRRIKRAGTHLLGLINEVLDLSKIESGKMTLEINSIDVGDFVAETLQTLGPAAEQNENVLTHHVAPDIAPLDTDITRLRQCLLNLLSNACKFTKNGQVTLNVRDDHECVVFEVIDTGIGLNEEQIGNLFRPFAQADSSVTRKFGGTGLGLAITRNLARLMGGDVTVTSVIGHGSTFTLSIRRAAARALAAPQAAERKAALVTASAGHSAAKDELESRRGAA